MKVVNFVRRALTSFLSMSPWPLELAGGFVLWHYGQLFSSNLPLSRDFRSIIAQMMPDDGWGFFARGLAYALFVVCSLVWLRGVTLYSLRALLSVLGLVCWGVLVYSCWRNNIPFAIYELYLFFLVTQIYVSMLIQARRHAEKDDD